MATMDSRGFHDHRQQHHERSGSGSSSSSSSSLLSSPRCPPGLLVDSASMTQYASQFQASNGIISPSHTHEPPLPQHDLMSMEGPQEEKPWVFLGGSCDPTTWRQDIAVPKLSRYGIPFYNPQISEWNPDFIALEAQAKEECQVLLFVIDGKTRAIASMLEATEYIMKKRQVVLVILDVPEGTYIDGELVGQRQLKDLNRARAFLCDIAARHQQCCDVFDSVENALNHVIYSHPSMSPHKTNKMKRSSTFEQMQQQIAISRNNARVRSAAQSIAFARGSIVATPNNTFPTPPPGLYASSSSISASSTPSSSSSSSSDPTLNLSDAPSSSSEQREPLVPAQS